MIKIDESQGLKNRQYTLSVAYTCTAGARSEQMQNHNYGDHKFDNIRFINMKYVRYIFSNKSAFCYFEGTTGNGRFIGKNKRKTRHIKISPNKDLS